MKVITQTSISLLLLVLNGSSQEEVSIRDIRILPNLNASYLPMMPDGSVLLVDNVWYVLKNLDIYVNIYAYLLLFLYCRLYLVTLYDPTTLLFIMIPLPLQPPVR